MQAVTQMLLPIKLKIFLTLYSNSYQEVPKAIFSMVRLEIHTLSIHLSLMLQLVG